MILPLLSSNASSVNALSTADVRKAKMVQNFMRRSGFLDKVSTPAKTYWLTVSHHTHSLHISDDDDVSPTTGNWCELSLRKLGHQDVFCHVGDNGTIYRGASLVLTSEGGTL